MNRVASVLAVLCRLPHRLHRDKPPRQEHRNRSRPTYEKHKGDFDYLLGDWEFVANNKQFGKSNGRWSAVQDRDGPDS